MKIVQVSVHTHLKHSLPNYGSVEYGAGITLEPEEGEDKDKLFQWGWLETMSQVLTQMNDRLKTPELQERLDKINDKKEEHG